MAIVLALVGVSYWAEASAPLEILLSGYALLSFIVYLATAGIPTTSESYSVFSLVITGIGGTLITVLGVRDNVDELIALGLLAQTTFFVLVAARTWKIPKLRVLAVSAIAFSILMVIIGGLVALGATVSNLLEPWLRGAISLLTWVVAPLYFTELARRLRTICAAPSDKW